MRLSWFAVRFSVNYTMQVRKFSIRHIGVNIPCATCIRGIISEQPLKARTCLLMGYIVCAANTLSMGLHASISLQRSASSANRIIFKFVTYVWGNVISLFLFFSLTKEDLLEAACFHHSMWKFNFVLSWSEIVLFAVISFCNY